MLPFSHYCLVWTFLHVFWMLSSEMKESKLWELDADNWMQQLAKSNVSLHINTDLWQAFQIPTVWTQGKLSLDFGHSVPRKGNMPDGVCHSQETRSLGAQPEDVLCGQNHPWLFFFLKRSSEHQCMHLLADVPFFMGLILAGLYWCQQCIHPLEWEVETAEPC